MYTKHGGAAKMALSAHAQRSSLFSAAQYCPPKKKKKKGDKNKKKKQINNPA